MTGHQSGAFLLIDLPIHCGVAEVGALSALRFLRPGHPLKLHHLLLTLKHQPWKHHLLKYAYEPSWYTIKLDNHFVTTHDSLGQFIIDRPSASSTRHDAINISLSSQPVTRLELVSDYATDRLCHTAG